MSLVRKVFPADESSGVFLRLEADGSIPVTIQDQVSPILITEMNRVTNTTALTNAVAIEDRTITIDSTTGFIAGGHIVIADDISGRYSIFHQVGAVAGSVVTLDRPIDFAYTAGVQVSVGTSEMAVDGSVTPVIFSVRGGDTPTGLTLQVDITRLIFKCLCTSAVDLSLFGNLGKLTNGLVCRRVDGTYSNIFNVKDNGEMAGIMFDFSISAALNPVQGVDGFTGRLTFAGQNKIGVAVRLGPGEDLQMIVQDNLTGLTSLEVVAEGHAVVA